MLRAFIIFVLSIVGAYYVRHSDWHIFWKVAGIAFCVAAAIDKGYMLIRVIFLRMARYA